MSVRALTALSVISIALVASACGKNTPAPASGEPPAPATRSAAAPTDPCKLLTNDELTQIFGSAHAITTSKGFVTGGDQACMWYDQDNFDSVQLILEQAKDFEAGKVLGEPRPLPGIGVEAYLSRHGTLMVKTATGAFHAQAVFPAGDGKVSDAVRTAAAGATEQDLAQYEASLRIARMVIDRL
jgi:hypothetical protein